MRNDTRGVSKIIGVVILVVIVIMLSVGVLFTAQTLIGDQPQDMTAGTTDERVDFYTHEAQLVNQGNTDTVYAVSPLGTEYKLEDAGDLQKILPLAKDSHPGVDQYQIVGERDGQRQLLKSNHFEEGVKPDVVVHDDGDKDYESIQTAINNIDDDTERDISSEEPGVIVVQKGVYSENIEVSDDITLIAEYGTVIQDANPNEDVVDIRGDNVRFQNFEVDGNPDPEDEDHYARHGINVQGSDAVIQGNTIRRADSPDVTSAAVRVNDKNTVVRYNNMRDSQQSINFGSNSASPAVCGNQFEDGIGGSVTSQTQTDVATLNHWNGGMPSNLARTVIAEEQKDSSTEEDGYTLPGNAPREVLENTNSRVDPSVLGEAAGQAALPFTGTKIGTSETPGECELSIGLVNDPEDGTSINIEEIEVTINGQTTTIEVVEEVNLGDGESADTRDGPTATCDCGGDGTYDPGDRISVSESSFGEIQTYTKEGTFEPLPFTEGEGSEPTPSSFNVQSSDGSSVETTSYSNPTPTNTEDDNTDDSDETTNSNDGGETQDFTILLGSSVDINLADEVVLEPVISGAESDPEDIEYEWDLGDGSTSTDRVVRHVYDEPGTYTVELTVTDPATDETDTDSTTVTVEEGTKDVEKIRSDEQQRLADLVEEDPDGDGKVLYLEEGTTYTTLDTINAQDLTIIGQGDDVELDGPITVTSSGVTMKNVAINNGLVVQNNDFKLYNSDVSNSDGYAVELNSNGGGFQIGESTLTGQDGVYVGVDNDVLISGNTIDSTGDYGVYTEEDIRNVRVRDNTITSNNIGIYESLAVNGEYERNNITAPTSFEQQEATAPEVNDISAEFTTTDVPLALSTEVSDPDGYPIDEVTWEVNGETFTRHPSNDLIYTFDEPGEYTLKVTVTDSFGKTTTESKTVTVEEFEASLTTSEEASQNDDVTATVEYNIPEYRVQSIEYDWGDGENDVVGDSSHTHAYTDEGEFDISVTVNPDEGESRTVTNSINIVDSPVADFKIEGDKTLYAGEPMTFNGGYSTVPDGRTLSYEWNMGDGTTYTTESPQHTYAETGTYTVSLTVSDSEGYSETVTKELVIDRFTVDMTPPTNPKNNVEGEFEVETSIDSSQVDEYIVDFDGDGQGDKKYSSAPFTYTFQESGERDITINVYDKNSAVWKDTETVDVGKAPVNPTMTVDKNELGVTLTLDEEETAPDTDITSVEWSLGDGTTATGSQVTHTYDSQGEYDVTVTVTDSRGQTVSETRTVTIDTYALLDGFESGNFNDWNEVETGMSPTVTTNWAYEGSYSLYLDTGGEDTYGTVTRNFEATDASGPYTFWVYQETDAYDDDHFRWKANNGASMFSFNINRDESHSNGEMQINGELTSSEFPHQEWTRVTVKNVDYETGTLDYEVVKESGETVISGSSSFDPEKVDYVDQFHISAASHYTGGTGEYYLDNVKAASSEVPLTAEMSVTNQDSPTKFTFDGTGSYPSPITSYEWDFGDGTTATGKTVTHNYESSGTYEATLTVTGENGETTTTTRTMDDEFNFQYIYADSFNDQKLSNRDSYSQTGHPSVDGSQVENGRFDWSYLRDSYYGGWTSNTPANNPAFVTQDAGGYLIESDQSIDANNYQHGVKYSTWIYTDGYWSGFRLQLSSNSDGGYSFSRSSTTSDYKFGFSTPGGDSYSKSHLGDGWYHVELKQYNDGYYVMTLQDQNGNQVVQWSGTDTTSMKGSIKFGGGGCAEGNCGDHNIDGILVEPLDER